MGKYCHLKNKKCHVIKLTNNFQKFKKDLKVYSSFRLNKKENDKK